MSCVYVNYLYVFPSDVPMEQSVTVPSPADHDEIDGFQGASNPQLATCSELQLGENKGRTRMLVGWIASVVSPYTTL